MSEGRSSWTRCVVAQLMLLKTGKSDCSTSQVVEGKVDFDVCLAADTILPQLKSIARILKQKMPTPAKGLLLEAMPNWLMAIRLDNNQG